MINVVTFIVLANGIIVVKGYKYVMLGSDGTCTWTPIKPKYYLNDSADWPSLCCLIIKNADVYKPKK